MHLNNSNIAFTTCITITCNLYNHPSCFLVFSLRRLPFRSFAYFSTPAIYHFSRCLTHHPYLAASWTHDRKYSYLRRPVAAHHNNDSPCIIIEPTLTRVFPPSIALLVLPLIPTALLIVYLTAAVYNSHIRTSFLRLTCPWYGSLTDVRHVQGRLPSCQHNWCHLNGRSAVLPVLYP